MAVLHATFSFTWPLISPHITSAHITSPSHAMKSNLTYLYHTSSHFILFSLTSPCLISPNLAFITVSHVTTPHHLISHHFPGFYLKSRLLTSLLTSPCLPKRHFSSLDITSPLLALLPFAILTLTSYKQVVVVYSHLFCWVDTNKWLSKHPRLIPFLLSSLSILLSPFHSFLITPTHVLDSGLRLKSCNSSIGYHYQSL